MRIILKLAGIGWAAAGLGHLVLNFDPEAVMMHLVMFIFPGLLIFAVSTDWYRDAPPKDERPIVSDNDW